MVMTVTVLEAMILQGKFVADSVRMIYHTLQHWPVAEGTTPAGTRRPWGAGDWTRHSYCVA